MIPTLAPSLLQTQQVVILLIQEGRSLYPWVLLFSNFFFAFVGVFIVIQVVCGQNCSFLVQSNGTVLAVGEGQYGRLGQGNSDDLYVPTIISAFQGTTFIQSRRKNMSELLWFFYAVTNLHPLFFILSSNNLFIRNRKGKNNYFRLFVKLSFTASFICRQDTWWLTWWRPADPTDTPWLWLRLGRCSVGETEILGNWVTATVKGRGDPNR